VEHAGELYDKSEASNKLLRTENAHLTGIVAEKENSIRNQQTHIHDLQTANQKLAIEKAKAETIAEKEKEFRKVEEKEREKTSKTLGYSLLANATVAACAVLGIAGGVIQVGKPKAFISFNGR
jgi:hypothetical protein